MSKTPAHWPEGAAVFTPGPPVAKPNAHAITPEELARAGLIPRAEHERLLAEAVRAERADILALISECSGDAFLMNAIRARNTP